LLLNASYAKSIKEPVSNVTLKTVEEVIMLDVLLELVVLRHGHKCRMILAIQRKVIQLQCSVLSMLRGGRSSSLIKVLILCLRVD